MRRVLRVLRVAIVSLVTMLLVAGVIFYAPEQPVESLKSRYANADSRFARIAGMDVHYRLTGRAGAPVLVCLHGFASSLHTWDGWAEALGDSMRLLRLDLPGYGLTGPPPSGEYSTAMQLGVIDTLLQQLGVDSVWVAGNSMGGALAAAYAAYQPRRVRRLILIDAAGVPGGSRGSSVLREARRGGNSQVLSVLRVPILADLLPSFTPQMLVERGLREVYAHDSLVTEALVERYYDLLCREGNRSGILQRMRAAPAMNSGGHPLDSIRARVLILWGEQDGWIPVANGRRFAELFAQQGTTVQLIEYPDLGHTPMEEDPRRTAADARRFLLLP